MADYDDGQQRSPFLVPPLPEEVIRNATTTGHKTGGGTETVVEAPERIAARQGIDTLEADHQRAMDAKLAHDEATAHINEESANAAVALADQQQAQRDAAYKATQPGIDEWRKRLRESMDRYDKAPAPKLFADGNTTENVLKGIGLALAGLGDAVTTRALITAGHAPTGKNSVSDLIDADLARQRENIQRLSDRIVTAKTGLGDAQAARAQLLAEVDQRGSVAFKRADLVAKARLAGEGADAAKIQSTLDQLAFRQRSEELKQASVAPLLNHFTTNHADEIGREHSDTQNINKPTPGAGTAKAPDYVTDTYSGQKLPVDQATTDRMQHNKAVGLMAQVNGTLQVADEILHLAGKNGQSLPEFLSVVGADTSKQAEIAGKVVQFRKAYGIAKGGESQAIPSLEELEQAIPNPPSDFKSAATYKNWLAKMNSARDDIMNIRKGNLAAAGVPLSDIERASKPAPSSFGRQKPAAAGRPARGIEPGEGNGPGSDAPLAEDPSAAHIDDVQKKPASPRDRAIHLLRQAPNYGKKGLLMKTYGITDAELAQ